jgi:hypothetical protein
LQLIRRRARALDLGATASRSRRRARALGLVALRGLGATLAWRISSNSRSRASSRLRSCVR